MDIQINIENAVASFTYADKQVVCGLLSKLDLSKDMNEATLNIKSVSENAALSRTMVVNCVKMLCCLGVIATENRGPAGTHIVVRNAKACRKIFDLCS